MSRGLLVVAFVGLLGSRAAADGDLDAPVRLEADGAVIDTGPAWGHSGPCAEDVDSDGLVDLVIGDFGGRFHYYRNTGDAANPRFTSVGNLRAGDDDASVRIYCCVGSQARFFDWNNDGLRDFVSNSYDPGHCYLFRREAVDRFSAREEVTDASGTPVRSTPVQQQTHQSFGSFFTPVDWDADGDADLLIGCFDGGLKLRMNHGDATSPEFAAENLVVDAGGQPAKVKAHLCPTVADWDGDGLWDLVAGSDDGSVTLFRNTGARSGPRFAKGELLVPPSDGSGYDLVYWDDSEITPGIRSQVDVADFNGDGKLDLLVGDFCTEFDVRDDLSDEERAEFRGRVAERAQTGQAFATAMQALRDDFAERFPGDAIYSDEADEAWSEEYAALRASDVYKRKEGEEAEYVRKLRPFLASTHGEGDRAYDLAKPHGYVWLFLRK